jgi:predicted GNAT family acetyltransferase
LEYCFLYTDLSNPTSNRIYMNVGYELVCESADYVFER